MIRLLRNTALLTTLVLMAGCASAPFPGQTPSARILVNNEHSDVASLTVHLVPSLGNTHRLGTVDLNRTKDFTVRRNALTGSYRLWARPMGGQGFYSPEFTLHRGDVVEWDLRMNQVFRLGNTSEGG